MSLIKGKSQKSFVKNIKSEMEAGKPQKQALAIAYNMKRKAKKMDDGGPVPSPSPEPKDATKENNPQVLSTIKSMASGFAHGGETGASMACPSCGYANGGPVKGRAMHAFHGGMADGGKVKEYGRIPGSTERGVHEVIPRYNKESNQMQYGSSNYKNENNSHKIERHKRVLEENRSMPNPKLKGLAHGGFIEDNYQSSTKPEVDREFAYEPAENASGFMEHEGDVKRPNHSAMAEDDRKLNQHGAIELGPEDGGGFHDETYLGRVNDPHDEYQPENPGTDLVGRVMAQKQQRFSEGGKVANDTEDHTLKYEIPNEFDDLVLRDDLESTYGDDDNAGDDLGNEQEDEDRHDIVARIMASRKKKDKNPVPA